jgi:acyl-CoA dehydrogenase
MKRRIFEVEHAEFRAAFRSFLDREAVPYARDWEAAGMVDREFWKRAGALGYLGFEAPSEFGGLSLRDYRFNAVMVEEVVASGTAGDGFALHNDIVAPYLLDICSPEQRARWLPGFVTGHTLTAIAMTEPDAGSDLARIGTTAVVDGDHLVLNGTKTFITNGYTADLIFVLARTGENAGRGQTLVAVERGTAGLSRGTPLRKIGRMAQDTAEIFLDDCRVPLANIVGTPGAALDIIKKNLPRERLSIAVGAVAAAERALQLAVEYARQRRTFGKPIAEHQVVLHQLAELHTAIQVARSHIDNCIVEFNAGELSAADAAGAKYWATDLEGSVTDRALQMFGGYGYMEEFPIGRMWRDARVQRIYGGANDILKDVVGRALIR